MTVATKIPKAYAEIVEFFTAGTTQERQRAEQEAQRAEQEAQKAELLAAKLRELNIDPDSI